MDLRRDTLHRVAATSLDPNHESRDSELYPYFLLAAPDESKNFQ